MSKLKKYIFSSFLALVMVVLPSVSIAGGDRELTQEEKEVLIASLKEQIKLLVEKIEAIKLEKKNSLVFNYDLKQGSRDSETNGEVSKLQKMLSEQGFYPEGIISGYYGNLTRLAVMRMQYESGLEQTGMFNQKFYDDFKEAKSSENKTFIEILVDNYKTNDQYMEYQSTIYGYQNEEEGFLTGAIIEAEGTYVINKGSRGDLTASNFVVNDSGAFSFPSEFEFISVNKDKYNSEIFTKLKSFSEDNPFVDKKELKALGDIQDKWILDTNDNTSAKDRGLTYYLAASNMVDTQKTYDNFYVDKESKEKEEELSGLYGEDVYEYDVVVDLEKTLKMIDFLDVKDEVEDFYKLHTEEDNLEDVLELMEVNDIKIYATSDNRLFGFYVSYSVDVTDDLGIVFTHEEEWYAYEKSDDYVDLSKPRDYIKRK